MKMSERIAGKDIQPGDVVMLHYKRDDAPVWGNPFKIHAVRPSEYPSYDIDTIDAGGRVCKDHLYSSWDTTASYYWVRIIEYLAYDPAQQPFTDTDI